MSFNQLIQTGRVLVGDMEEYSPPGPFAGLGPIKRFPGIQEWRGQLWQHPAMLPVRENEAARVSFIHRLVDHLIGPFVRE